MDLLAIPDFLDRRKDPPSKVRKPRKPKSMKSRTPTLKKFIGSKSGMVCLSDDCPRIGNGWRYVWYVKGKRWVYLSTSDNRTGRLSIEKFNKTFKEE